MTEDAGEPRDISAAYSEQYPSEDHGDHGFERVSDKCDRGVALAVGAEHIRHSGVSAAVFTDVLVVKEL